MNNYSLIQNQTKIIIFDVLHVSGRCDQIFTWYKQIYIWLMDVKASSNGPNTLSKPVTSRYTQQIVYIQAP